MICVSIAEKSTKKSLEVLKGLNFAEIRLDKMSVTVDDVRKIFSQHPRLIATCRPGVIEDKKRKLLLEEAISAGAAFVDLELEASDVLISCIPCPLFVCDQDGFSNHLVAALFDEEITLVADGSLKHRPVGMMEKPLRSLGAFCSSTCGFPPMIVKGPIRGGKTEIDGSISSQFLTGLLMAFPVCGVDSELKVRNLKSKPYVSITVDLLKHFQIDISLSEDFNKFFIKGNQIYKNKSCCVEGDWSAASFLLVGGALCGSVTVKRLLRNSSQADKRICDVLEMAGAHINVTEDKINVEME